MFPLRSVLYVPACNAKALAKVPSLPCDAVIFDLEDSVAPEAKAEARAQLAAQYHGAEPGTRQLCVRINRAGTAWYDEDIKLAAKLSPDAVVLPKVESAAELKHLAHDLFTAGCSDRTRLWALIETPKGVLAAATLAEGNPRLSALVLGLNDLASGLNVALTPDRAALMHAMSTVLLAARAQGLMVLDGVYPVLGDSAGFTAQCAQARSLGFDGKTLIHPAQITPANAAFSPSATEIAWAQKVSAAWTAGSHKGVTVVDGQMIEELHVKQAERLLSLAQHVKAKS